ncbi:MAG: hydroxyacylglutathione hydrolase [Thermoproteota archaeon]|nr:hydroxyacylglutathione hydrolase [Thermoproteota archaeon]
MKATEFIYVLKCPIVPVVNNVDPLIYTTVNVILGDEITIIDTGFNGFWKTGVLPFLKRMKRDPNDVSLILHTHSHFDHVDGDDEILEATGAKVAISEVGADMLENPEKEQERLLSLFDHLLSKREQEAVRSRPRRQPKPRHVDRRLKTGDVVDLGPFSLECFPLRGHSACSLGLYDRDEEIMFTGDALFGRGAIRDTFVITMASDIHGFYESLAMLKDMSIRMILPAHNYLPYAKAILRDEEARGMIEHTLSINLEIREMILRLLRTYRRLLGAAEMSSLIVPRLGPGYIIPPPEPNRVVLAHLDALIQENMIERIEKEDSILFRLKR